MIHPDVLRTLLPNIEFFLNANLSDILLAKGFADFGNFKLLNNGQNRYGAPPQHYSCVLIPKTAAGRDDAERTLAFFFEVDGLTRPKVSTMSMKLDQDNTLADDDAATSILFQVMAVNGC